MSSSVSNPQSSSFVRAARFVGDFGNPFYEEERHRDVWNEASAFGFQLFILTAFLFSTVCIWLVGRPALPYVQVGMVLTGVISGATLMYAQRLGVDVLQQPQRLNRARMVPIALLVLLLGAGTVRAASGGSWDRGTATGAGIGLLLVLALFVLTDWKMRRTRRAADTPE